MKFIIEIFEYHPSLIGHGAAIAVQYNLCWECKIKGLCFIATKAKEIEQRMEGFRVRVTKCPANEAIGDVEI